MFIVLRRLCACWLVLAIASVLSPDVASAANIFWDGTGTNWNDNTVWSTSIMAITPNPGSPPGASDTVFFNINAATTPQTVNLNAAQSAAGLVFSKFSDSVLIQTGSGTNKLALGASGINVLNGAAGGDTITSGVSLADTQTWTNNSSSLLTISGNIADGSSSLSVAGAGNTTISGVLGSGSGSLTKDGAGTLTLSNSNTFSGGVNLNAGTLLVGRNSALGSGALNLANGVMIQADGAARVLSNALTLGGDFSIGGSNDLTLTSPTSLTANRSITVTGVGIATLSGNIGQDIAGRSLTKSGSGTLRLSGNNTFSGGVNLNDGTLQLGNAGALNSVTPVAVAFGASSTGALSLSGNSVTISSLNNDALLVGTPIVQNASATPATLTVNGSGSFDGILQNGTGGGALALVKSGSGTLRLAGNNTFSGGVTVSAGILQVGHDSALGSGPLNLASGVTIQADGAARVLSNALTLGGDFTVSGLNDLTLSSPTTLTANRTVSVIRTAGFETLTMSGAIGQDIAGRSLTKSGSGTLRLSGNNTFSGGVNLNDGTLLIGSDSALGSGPLTLTTTAFSTTTIQADGAARVLSNALTLGGDFSISGSNDLTFSSPITLTASRGITVTGTGIATLSGAVGEDSVIRSLSKSGSGTLRLSGNNTFYGMTIFAGTLLVGSDSALGSGEIQFEGGTIEADGGPRTISQIVTVEGTVTVDGSQDVTFDQVFSNSLVTNRLIKNGTGTFTLSPNTASPDIDSDLIVNAGTLALGGISLSSTANLVIGDGTGVDTIRMLAVVGSPRQLATVTVNSSGILDLNGTQDTTVFNLKISGGSVTTGAGKLTLNSGAAVTSLANSQTATISGSVRLLGDHLFDVADGGATIDLDVSANLVDAFAATNNLTKSGAGTLRLSGNNTFSGGVTVTGGALVVGSNSALGTVPLTINGGAADLGNFSAGVAQVNLMAGSLSMIGNLTIGAGGLLGQNLQLDTTKSVTLSGTTTIEPGHILTINGGTLSTGALAGTGAFNFIGGTLGVTGTAGLTIGTGNIVGTTFSLGGGDFLNVTNTLHIGGTGRLTNVGSNVLAGSVQLDAGGRWTVSDGLQSVGTGLVNHGTLVLVDTTINGPVTSPAGSVVNVVGRVTFNQLFAGAGQFFGSGTTTFNGGYSPGDSPATVTFQGSVVLGGTNSLAVELGGTTPGTQFDQVHVTGQSVLDGTLQVSLINGFMPQAGQSFDILDWGTLSGTFSTLQLPSLAGGLTWNTSQLYTSGLLSVQLLGDYNGNGMVDAADYVVWRKGLGAFYTQTDYNVWRTHFGQTAGSGAGVNASTSVPEPYTMLLLLLGLLAMCSCRRPTVS